METKTVLTMDQLLTAAETVKAYVLSNADVLEKEELHSLVTLEECMFNFIGAQGINTPNPQTLIALSEDDQCALTNLHTTIIENADALEDVVDFEGDCSVSDCLKPGADAIKGMFPFFNM